MNKFVAKALLGSIIAIFVMVILEGAVSPEAYEAVTTLIGLCFLVFGTWASIIILKHK